MSSAGLKPSAAITRGMTETQAAIVNSRWLRHSAAGVSEAPTPRALAASGRSVEGDLRRPEPELPLRRGDPGPQTPDPAKPTPKARRRRPRRGAGWFRGRSPISLLLAS